MGYNYNIAIEYPEKLQPGIFDNDIDGHIRAVIASALDSILKISVLHYKHPDVVVWNEVQVQLALNIIDLHDEYNLIMDSNFLIQVMLEHLDTVYFLHLCGVLYEATDMNMDILAYLEYEIVPRYSFYNIRISEASYDDG